MTKNKKKMDYYDIPLTSIHKSQLLAILNASQSQYATGLKATVTAATTHMIMSDVDISHFITIINASTAQNKTELVNIMDPNGPTPPIKL